MQDRLQKIIARAGIASRRAAEEYIVAGRVRVNGRVVSELGAKADPRQDKIEVDGQRLVAEDLHYIVLHKPRNVVSTLRDPEGRPTVGDYVRGLPARVYPVGRLDFATSGVLLMTNDGEFANALLHPKGGVPKTYVLKVQGEMSDNDLEPWRRGVMLDDGKTLPAQARLLRHEGDKSWIEVTLREGRNQQIRRMGDATGWRVMRLARMSFAGVTAETLRPGEWRPLGRDELLAIKKEFGVPHRVRPATEVPERGAVPARPPPPRGARAASRPERPSPRGPRAERGEAPAGTTRPAKPREQPPAATARPANPRDRSQARGPVRSERTDRSGTTPRGAATRGSRARGRGDR